MQSLVIVTKEGIFITCYLNIFLTHHFSTAELKLNLTAIQGHLLRQV